MKASHLLLAVLITAIWGFNFSVIKLGLQSVDPFILAGIRFTLCALPMVFFIRFPQVAIGYVITYGLLFGVGLWGIVNLGIQAGLSAGIASLVLQFSAFFTILLGALVFHESISKYQYAGLAIALLGLGLIINITDGTVTLVGIALVIFGALCWSLANIVIKKAGTKEVFAFLVWSSLFSPIPLCLPATWPGDLCADIGTDRQRRHLLDSVPGLPHHPHWLLDLEFTAENLPGIDGGTAVAASARFRPAGFSAHFQ